MMNKYRKNKKWFIGIFLFLFFILIMSVFSIKAQEGIDPIATTGLSDKDFAYIYVLSQQAMKLGALTDDLDDLIFKGGDVNEQGNTEVKVDSFTPVMGIDDMMKELKLTKKNKIISNLSQILPIINSNANILNEESDKLENITNRIQNLISEYHAHGVEKILLKQEKVSLIETNINDQERYLEKFSEQSDNDTENQILRVGKLRDVSDKILSINKYISDFYDEFILAGNEVCFKDDRTEANCDEVKQNLENVINTTGMTYTKLNTQINSLKNIPRQFQSFHTQEISKLEGDLTGDGKVDIFDLVTVAKNFGKKL